jgi:hypothetical protein
MGELGRSGADAPSGLRPFGAEPATQSQAEPLVPNAFSAKQHASGWWVVVRPDGCEIDDSGDGGFFRVNAEIIAAALNDYGAPLATRHPASRIEARSDETLQAAQPEGQEPDGEAGTPKTHRQDTPSPPEDM